MMQQRHLLLNILLDPEKYLVHACLEGPEAGVYYRGKGKLDNFKTEIKLPDYATQIAKRFYGTQLTPISPEEMCKMVASALASSEVDESGTFIVQWGSIPTSRSFGQLLAKGMR